MEAAAGLEVVHSPPSPPGHGTRVAGKTLAAVGAVGVAVALLTWRAEDAGLGWLVADVVLVGAVLGGVARGRPRFAEVALGAASLWMAAMTAWRASDWALATALPGSVVMLGMLALVAARRLGAASVVEVGGVAWDALRSVPGGIVDAARTPVHAVGAGARGHVFGVLRGALVGVPLAGFFTLLLSADAGFRHALLRLIGSAGDGLDLAVWIGATTAGLLVGQAVLSRVRRAAEEPPVTGPAWAVGPYRAEGDAPLVVAQPVGPRVRPLTWGVVLGHVVAVFALYVAANASTLFAGHEHVRARGTVTYAEYLHEGFTQVSIATLLAVACVVLGHLLLRPRGAGAGAAVAGGKLLVAVELALLLLVGVTLASCAHRLALYEEAYGYTYLRLGVWVLQLGVAGLLLTTGARCVARAWRGWGTALVWSGVAFGVLVGSIDADGRIAERNVARAQRGASLDVAYLGDLSEDARGVLADVTAIDLDAGALLAAQWEQSRAAHRGHGWRAMRGIGAR
jgi:hypothetical protein